MTANIQFYVSFGDGDGSDWFDDEVELTPEEVEIYNQAVKDWVDLDEVEGLEDALERAYREIEEIEIQNALDMGDDYALECLGKYQVDADEINELVHKADPHAVEFFHLEDLSKEELQKWDANELDDLPNVCDFDPNFEACSPFDRGWDLSVRFADPDDDDYEDDEDDEYEADDDEIEVNLYHIFMMLAQIENGLAYGEIEFRYDTLMCSLKPGHPADILDDIFGEIGNELYSNHDADIDPMRLEVVLEYLKDFKEAFHVKEIKVPIKCLELYLKEHGEHASNSQETSDPECVVESDDNI